MSLRNILSSALSAGLLGATIHAAEAATYEVALTNATRGLLFTPRLVITHSAGEAFALGQPAVPNWRL